MYDSFPSSHGLAATDPHAADPAGPHGGALRDAGHLGAQSLGRAADATNSMLQNALFDIQEHHGDYAQLPEKSVQRSHEAMSYVSAGSAIADDALRSDGNVLQNLFTDPKGLPAMGMMLMSMSHHHG
ncbi:hypothetical protein T492DRAFT_847038 [Pavlovales sp. CCMP2436]|nr:hypothetical protein T492DRAFT_847038 [Pavlovales sp. CCMP2436]